MQRVPYQAGLLVTALILAACGTPSSDGMSTAAVGTTQTAAAALTATQSAVLELTPSGDHFFLTATAEFDTSLTSAAASAAAATTRSILTASPTQQQLDPASLTPSWTPSPAGSVTPDYAACAWVWATQPQPEVLADILRT